MKNNKSAFTKQKRTAKIIAASTLGFALLLGGSTYALWSATDTTNSSSTISTGDLKVTAASTQNWFDVTDAGSPTQITDLSSYRLSPGRTLQLKQDLNVVVIGDNMSGILKVKIPNDTLSLPLMSQAVFTLTLLDKDGVSLGSVTPVTNSPSALSLEITDLPQTLTSGDLYTVEISVSLPLVSTNATKDQTVNLGNMQITLSQGDFSAVPNPASDFSWQVVSNVAIIQNYIGTSSDVVIPSKYKSGGITYPVTTIGTNAFLNKSLTSVVLPNSLTAIATGAFQNNFLSSIKIPNSVTQIGLQSFAYNKITSVTLPNAITSLGDSAFRSNKLSSIKLPNTLTNLGSITFYDNPFTSVTIPSSVTIIGQYAFDNNVTSYYFDGNAPTIAAAGTAGSFGLSAGKTIYRHSSATGYSNPWQGYTTSIY